MIKITVSPPLQQMPDNIRDWESRLPVGHPPWPRWKELKAEGRALAVALKRELGDAHQVYFGSEEIRIWQKGIVEKVMEDHGLTREEAIDELGKWGF